MKVGSSESSLELGLDDGRFELIVGDGPNVVGEEDGGRVELEI